MRVLHLNQALADEQREMAFWKEQSPGLELEFLNELEKAIDMIKKAPEGYARASKNTKLRRFVEDRFNTAILFRYVKKDDLLIIARVYNCRMDPKRFIP
jgi:hypothetical protein